MDVDQMEMGFHDITYDSDGVCRTCRGVGCEFCEPVDDYDKSHLKPKWSTTLYLEPLNSPWGRMKWRLKSFLMYVKLKYGL